MPLPDNFIFSQRSLQDYVDCPRRFQLRYLLRMSWPAVEAEPALEHERKIQQGARFHKMVYQHFLGIPAERITKAISDRDLELWWSNYLTAKPGDFPGEKYSEITLSSFIGKWGLSAKYDLLVLTSDGKGTILDWKTSDHLPPAEWHLNRLQTKVYRYLLMVAGSRFLENGAFSPEDIEMVYWYAGFPDQPIRLPYSQEQADHDELYLAELISEIKTLSDEKFPLTDDLRRCRFCTYRSFCERGDQAGQLYEMPEFPDEEPDIEIDFDYDQIAEIEF